MAELNLYDLNLWAKEPEKMIENAEEKYHSRIERIAKYVTENPEIRLILLAGPSGSGKTTSANLIADNIRRLGEEAEVISLDDFYRDHDDPSYPKNLNGTHDYERPDSLNLPLLCSTLLDIVENRPFSVPKYDFKEGRCVSVAEKNPVGNGCVIIEGLHAMNPLISENLPAEKVVKLFVSVSTNINHEGKRIISGRKVRFLRRLVRDSIYRGADAIRTLNLWRGVLEAEDIYLYPYKSTADLAFDTFHPFELGAMKKRAEALLDIKELEGDGYTAVVLNAIKHIDPVDDSLIPENSLIREFIAGGIYDDIY